MLLIFYIFNLILLFNTMSEFIITILNHKIHFFISLQLKNKQCFCPWHPLNWQLGRYVARLCMVEMETKWMRSAELEKRPRRKEINCFFWIPKVILAYMAFSFPLELVYPFHVGSKRTPFLYKIFAYVPKRSGLRGFNIFPLHPIVYELKKSTQLAFSLFNIDYFCI